MDLSLDALLQSLQTGMDKSAEECKDEEKKEEKEDKGDGEKKLPPWLKDKEGKSEGKKDDEKSEDKDEKKEEKSEGQEKSASEAGAALAREIMEKVASIKLETQPEMKKEAQSAGKALGEALLANLQKSAAEKKANTGDMTVMDGSSAPGTVPDKVKVDQAATVAEGEATIKPMLTGDGIKNTGTINEIFDAMVADALSQGAASEEQVHSTGLAGPEGNAESAVPNQVKVASETEEHEKAAAVNALVEQGVDFLDAVELVKQAAAEIEFELEKSAAMQALMAEGVDFDQAVELVKQASTGDVTVLDGSAAPGTVGDKVKVDQAASVAEGEAAIKPLPTGDGIKNSGSINQIFDAIVQDALSQGAASEEQVHTTGVASAEGAAEHAVPNQVKVAAISKLTEAGVDFDKAVEFVKEAAEASKKKDHMLKGWISPAWQENSIAKDHGKEGPKGAWNNVKSHVGGSLRTSGRSIVESTAGLAAGAGIGAAGGALVSLASKGKIKMKDGATAGALATGLAGTYAGSFHGAQKSLRNQAKEHHAKYAQEKKAAFDALIEAGVDFNEAAAEHAVPNQVKVAAMNKLMEAGVDFEQAAEFVKVAADTSREHFRELSKQVGHGFAEADFDNRFGMKHKGANHYHRSQVHGEAMADGRGLVEAIGGGALGAAAGLGGSVMYNLARHGKGVGSGVATGIGAGLGYIGGTIHGINKSYDNSADKLYKKYEKKAALESLIFRSNAGKMVDKLKNTPMINGVKPMVADAKLQGSRLIGRDSPVGGSKLMAAKALAKNPLVAGAAGAGVIGGAALAMRNREKKAAFDALVEAGVDFNEAAQLVANKAAEIYGE